MREISITEVYDPSVDKFIPVKTATEKGIFDPVTYDYHDPVDNATYKVSEAAKRGLFNTSMSTVPDKLTIEKVRVAQTLSILKVVDPRDDTKVLKAKKAIKEGIIDLKRNLYRNPDTKETIDIDEAIEEGFITVRIMKECTEKVTEKYEEQLKEDTSDVETTTIIEEDKPTPAVSTRSSFNIEDEDEPESEEPTYYERTQSTQLNKTIQSSKLKNNALAVALVKDSKKKKLINIFDAIEQKIFDNKSATYHDTENNYKINLASAIEKGYIILPDSEYLTKYIDKVRDVASCCWLDLETAIDMDLIDLKNKLFKNTLTTNYTSLFQALKDNYLKLYEVDINTNMDFSVSDKDIETVFDPLTNEQVPIWKAIKLGLVNKRLKAYIDPKSRKLMSLSEAVDKGVAVLSKETKRKLAAQDSNNDEVEEKIIKGVIHPLSGERLNLKDAIDYGILDYTECTLQDLKSGETLTLQQAYERGFLITAEKQPSGAQSPTLSRRSSHDSNDHDEDTKGDEALKKKHPYSSVSPRQPGDNGDMLMSKMSPSGNSGNRSHSNIEKGNSNIKVTLDDYKVLSIELKKTKSDEAIAKKVPKIEANSTKRSMQDLELIEELNATLGDDKKDSLSLRIPMEERLNSTEIDMIDDRQPGDRRSFLQKFKSKLFGSKKPEPLTTRGVLDQEAIIRSLTVYDTKAEKEYSLMRAIHKGIVISADRITDTAEDVEIDLKEAVAKSILYFPVHDSVKVDNTDSIFYNDLNLFIIYHVIDPITKARISVNEALSKNYLNKVEATYFDGRAYILLIDAIEQQLVCGSYVHFRHLAQLVNSCAQKMQESSRSASFFSLRSQSSSHSRSRSKSKSKSQTDIRKEAAANTSNVIPPEILKKAVKKFDESKTYIVDKIYNTSTQEFQNFDIAVQTGIYLPATYQFYDIRKKKKSDLAKAIRKRKIKVAVQSTAPKTEPIPIVQSKEAPDNLSEGTIKDLVVKKFTNLDEEIVSVLGSSAQPNRVVEVRPEVVARIVPEKDANKRFKVLSAFNPIEKRDMPIDEAIHAGIYLPATHEYYDLRYNKVYSLEKAFKDDKVKIVQIDETASTTKPFVSVRRLSNPNNLETSTDNLGDDEAFDLASAILYYFPHEKKFVKFREVLQQGLYDPANGLIKDVTFKDYISLNEALQRRVVKLIDPNVLYDKANIYHVKSVVGPSGVQISLRDAVEKEKIINRDACTYKYKNSVSLVANAIREGFIEADVLNEAQIKEALRSFYEKEISADEEDNLKDLYPTELTSGSRRRRNSGKKTTRPRKGQFDEVDIRLEAPKSRTVSENTAIYIVDVKNCEHISVEEAIAKNVFNAGEREIADTSTGEYFTIKEAVARGLIATINHNLLERFQKSAFYTHKHSSYIIDAIHDPKRKKFFSLQQSLKNGLFSNGIYRNPLNGAVYPIHEALESGFVIGRQVEVDEIEHELMRCLQIAPKKPIRGNFLSESMISQPESQKTASSGKIGSVRDVASGRLVKPQEAEKMGILNLMQGWFKDSRSMEKLTISDAIEKGFIVIERRDLNETISDDSEATLNATVVSKKSQGKFTISGVVDTSKKVELSVSEAISKGIFDPNSGTYVCPLTKKRYNMVEAIDMSLIKIGDEVSEEKLPKNVNKASDVNSFSVRYAVDVMSKKVMPINEASRRNVVDLQHGFLIDRQTGNKMNFKTAYDCLLLFSADDLDNPLSERSNFQIDVVRNSKSGKEMSLKSALAKGWISIDRRTYKNKATGEEVPFSKAVDVGLIVLSLDLPDSYKFESSEFVSGEPLNEVRSKRALSDPEVMNGVKSQHFAKNPQLKLSGDGVQSRPIKKNLKKK